MPKEKIEIEISPWRKSAKLQRRKNQRPSVRNGKSQSQSAPSGRSQPQSVLSGESQPPRRLLRLRRFSFAWKERCPHLAAQRTPVCRRMKDSRCFRRPIFRIQNTLTYSCRRRRQVQPDLGGGLTRISTILPAAGI